jgi:hypothetical protein
MTMSIVYISCNGSLLYNITSEVLLNHFVACSRSTPF